MFSSGYLIVRIVLMHVSSDYSIVRAALWLTERLRAA
jgi:hypothetical protein